ncbi:MAG: hypothetical protein ACKOWC_01395 [Limnohabitans sp.]
MGTLLHDLHAKSRPAAEAQAAAADAALFATMGQALTPRKEPAADILGRLADKAERIKDAAVKLWPDEEVATPREHHLYGDACELSARLQSVLTELHDIEAKRGDEKNDPRSLGHYPHLKPAGRMVAA